MFVLLLFSHCFTFTLICHLERLHFYLYHIFLIITSRIIKDKADPFLL